jgi:cold shock CspA family protein
MQGTVDTFDEAAGLGTVRGAGGAIFPFHCTQLADGTRTVPRGAAVTFQVVPGHQGRWEAAAIERCASSG